MKHAYVIERFSQENLHLKAQSIWTSIKQLQHIANQSYNFLQVFKSGHMFQAQLALGCRGRQKYSLDNNSFLPWNYIIPENTWLFFMEVSYSKIRVKFVKGS